MFKPGKTLLIISAILFAIAAMICGILMIGPIQRADWHETQGVVVEQGFAYVIDYTVDGTSYRWVEGGSRFPLPEPGTFTTIRYNPENPSEAALPEDYMAIKIAGGIVGGLGGAFLLFAGIFHLAFRNFGPLDARDHGAARLMQVTPEERAKTRAFQRRNPELPYYRKEESSDTEFPSYHEALEDQPPAPDAEDELTEAIEDAQHSTVFRKDELQ